MGKLPVARKRIVTRRHDGREQTPSRGFRYLWMMVGVLLMVAAPLSATTLQIGSVSNASPGSTVTLPIIITGAGTSSCAMEYNLTWDSSALTYQGVSTGPAATAAGKLAYESSKTAGGVKISVFGVNSNVVSDGVIANVVFLVAPSATGMISLNGQCSVSDCLGNLVTSTCASGAVTVAASCQTPGTPVLTVPSSASSGANYSVTWPAATNATEYRVEESVNADFSGATASTVSAGPSTLQPEALLLARAR